MDSDRLKVLTERADRAKALAADVQMLQDGHPGKHPSARARYETWDTGSSLLNTDLLDAVLIAGVDAVLRRKEQELEALLDPTIVTVAKAPATPAYEGGGPAGGE